MRTVVICSAPKFVPFALRHYAPFHAGRDDELACCTVDRAAMLAFRDSEPPRGTPTGFSIVRPVYREPSQSAFGYAVSLSGFDGATPLSVDWTRRLMGSFRHATDIDLLVELGSSGAAHLAVRLLDWASGAGSHARVGVKSIPGSFRTASLRHVIQRTPPADILDDLDRQFSDILRADDADIAELRRQSRISTVISTVRYNLKGNLERHVASVMSDAGIVDFPVERFSTALSEALNVCVYTDPGEDFSPPVFLNWKTDRTLCRTLAQLDLIVSRPEREGPLTFTDLGRTLVARTGFPALFESLCAANSRSDAVTADQALEAAAEILSSMFSSCPRGPTAAAWGGSTAA